MVLLYLIFVDWQWCLCCLVLNHFKMVWFVLSSDARVMWDQKTGRSRGYGFVSFRNQQVCWFSVPTIWICALSVPGFCWNWFIWSAGCTECHKWLKWYALKTFLVQTCFMCSEDFDLFCLYIGLCIWYFPRLKRLCKWHCECQLLSFKVPVMTKLQKLTFLGQWLGNRQIRCNWATKGANSGEDQLTSDSKSIADVNNNFTGIIL